MSNASIAAAGTSMESPPVLGSTLFSGIVSRITPSLVGVLSPSLPSPVVGVSTPVLAPVVVVPVVVPVVVTVASPAVVGQVVAVVAPEVVSPGVVALVVPAVVPVVSPVLTPVVLLAWPLSSSLCSPLLFLCLQNLSLTT